MSIVLPTRGPIAQALKSDPLRFSRSIGAPILWDFSSQGNDHSWPGSPEGILLAKRRYRGEADMPTVTVGNQADVHDPVQKHAQFGIVPAQFAA